MNTFYRPINPTSSDNVDSGYPIGSIWINTITYSGYEQTQSGVWVWSAENSNTVNSNFFPVLTNYSPIIYYVNSGENITNVYYVNSGSTSGGTADINIGQLTGYSGENFIVINGNGTPTENGQLLKDVYGIAKTLTPNGDQISAYNPINIYLSPGIYQTTSNLTYRISLNNIDQTELSGNLSISINTVMGQFVFSEYSDGITPLSILSTTIQATQKGESSFSSIYSVLNESGIPVISGDSIFLDFEYVYGYSIEPYDISISIKIDGVDVYDSIIQKLNPDPLIMDKNGVNLKTLYPCSFSTWNINESGVLGGPVVDAISIISRMFSIDGITVQNKLRINYLGNETASLFSAHNCIFSDLGSTFDEIISGDTLYVGGLFKNCKFIRSGCILPGTATPSRLYVNGTFENCSFSLYFGLCMNEILSNSIIQIDSTFKDCICSGLGFGVSINPNVSILINSDFYNCITESCGFGAIIDGGSVSISGSCINCDSNTKNPEIFDPINLLPSFASGSSNNSISGKLFKCSMVKSGSFNQSNLTSGVISNCINSTGLVVNSYS